MTAQDSTSAVPIVVHRPEGAIDISNSAELRDAMLVDIEAGARAMILDLESVPYVDSSGLSSLLNVATALEGRGGKIILCHLDPSVHKVLEMTRLTEYFVVTGDREEAEASARGLLSV